MDRQSSIENMRVYLMFLIILHHIGIHGGLVNSNIRSVRIYGMMIASFGQVVVIIFICLYGYFAIYTPFKSKRLINIYIIVLIYGIFFWIISRRHDLQAFFCSIFPLSFKEYNFVNMYIIIAVIFPLLKTFALKISYNIAKKIFIIGFLFLMVLPLFLRGGVEIVNSSIYPLYLALIGAEMNRFKGNKKSAKKIYFYICICVYVIGVSIISAFFPTLWATYIGFYSPFSFLCAISILFIVSEKRTSKFNFGCLSKYVFSVFVIHENPLLRPVLWDRIFRIEKISKELDLCIFVIYVLICSFIVFICACIVEMTRVKIFEKLFGHLRFTDMIIRSCCQIDYLINGGFIGIKDTDRKEKRK